MARYHPLPTGVQPGTYHQTPSNAAAHPPNPQKRRKYQSSYDFVFPYAPPSLLLISNALLYGGAVGGCTGSKLTQSSGK